MTKSMESQKEDISRRDFIKTGGVVAASGAAMIAAARQVHASMPPYRQTSEKKVRIGIVGGGFGLAFHWHQEPNCKVEAVSDLRPDRRNNLMKAYKCDKAYESLEKMILDPKIEAIALFTGAPDHARHVLMIMGAGKHVISAVPACMKLEEAQQMKEIKERTGFKYMMAETSYYRAPTITARRLYEDGKFGELVYCEGEYYHYFSSGKAFESLCLYKGKPTWRYGYPPMLYPTHTTGFIVGATRERLVKVSCVGMKADYPHYHKNAYDNPFNNQFGHFVTDKGHVFRGNVCWGIYSGGERAQWIGVEGALYMSGVSGQPYNLRLPKGQGSSDVCPSYFHTLPEKMRYNSGHGGSHPFITHEFIMALVEDREPTIDLYEALAMTVPGIVAHQSCFKDGEQLAVPSFDLV
jgi:predicted dehydrogenase